MEHTKLDYNKVADFVKCNYDVNNLSIKDDFSGFTVPNTETDLLCEWGPKHGLKIEKINYDTAHVIVENEETFKDYYNLWQYESELQKDYLDVLNNQNGKVVQGLTGEINTYPLRKLLRDDDFPNRNDFPANDYRKYLEKFLDSDLVLMKKDKEHRDSNVFIVRTGESYTEHREEYALVDIDDVI